jgi:hypothetical protein
MLLMDYSTPRHARRRRRESVSLILHETTALEDVHSSINPEETVLAEVPDLIIQETIVLEEAHDSTTQETTVSAEVQNDSSLQLELLPRLMPMGHH